MTRTTRRWLQTLACGAALSLASTGAVGGDGDTYVTVSDEFMAHEHKKYKRGKPYIPVVRYSCSDDTSGELRSSGDQPFCIDGAVVEVAWGMKTDALKVGEGPALLIVETETHQTQGDANGYCTQNESPIWSVMRCEGANAGPCSQLVQHEKCRAK